MSVYGLFGTDEHGGRETATLQRSAMVIVDRCPVSSRSRHATVHAWTALGLAGLSYTAALFHIDLPYSVGLYGMCSPLRTPQWVQVDFTNRDTPARLRTAWPPCLCLLVFVVPTAILWPLRHACCTPTDLLYTFRPAVHLLYSTTYYVLRTTWTGTLGPVLHAGVHQ